MRKTKVILAVFMAFALIFLAACGSSNNNANNENGNTPANNTPVNEQPPVEEEPVVEERQIDMNGEVLRILSWGAEPNEETPEGAAQVERFKQAEEKYNVDIVWEQVPWGVSRDEVATAALSGEARADFVLLDMYMGVPAIKDGLFMPVTDFFDFSDPKWPAGIETYGAWNGEMYGIVANANNFSGLYFNKTLLEREGQPNPHDLAAEGKWNWDEFLKIMKAVTKDTDGDGVIDQWGVTNHAANFARIIVASNNSSFMTQDETGKYVYNYQDPKLIEALRFFDQIYNVDKVYAPNTTADFNAYTESQTLFSNGKAAFVTGEQWEGSQRTTMTDEQGFIYFPKGPQAGDMYQGTVENYTFYYMPANVKRAEEKAYIFDQIQLWERFEDQRREANEQQLLSDERDIEVMMDMSARWTQPTFWPGSPQATVGFGITKGESPETLLEQQKQTIQDEIDKYYNVAQ